MAQAAPSRTITVGDIAITYLPDGEGHFDPVGMFPASDEATPGHQSVVVSSGAGRAVLLGDVAHCPAQLLEPEWAVLFDVEAAFGRIVRGEGTQYWTSL